MTRLAAFVASLAAVAAALAGCAEGDRAYIREGTADAVTISYRGDVAVALPLAKQHCAQFERVPQLVQADTELAVFDCRRP